MLMKRLQGVERTIIPAEVGSRLQSAVYWRESRRVKKGGGLVKPNRTVYLD